MDLGRLRGAVRGEGGERLQSEQVRDRHDDAAPALPADRREARQSCAAQAVKKNPLAMVSSDTSHDASSICLGAVRLERAARGDRQDVEAAQGLAAAPTSAAAPSAVPASPTTAT